jgi:hypothetical protein
MLIYYDKIFKDTAEHKIDYSRTDIMALIGVTDQTKISLISLVHIANNGNDAILRT